MTKDEIAIVLDFLPHGYPGKSKEAVAQAMGTNNYSLLELVPRKDINLVPLQQVYIGQGKREEINHIKRKLNLDDLTGTAREELNHIIEQMVTEYEEHYVEFFNKAGPLSMRLHSLELLPGVGKKHMWEILDARKAKLFESYEDIKDRVKQITEPKKLIIRRIFIELENKDKYRLFTA